MYEERIVSLLHMLVPRGRRIQAVNEMAGNLKRDWSIIKQKSVMEKQIHAANPNSGVVFVVFIVVKPHKQL